MYDPNNPVQQVPGQMNIMGALSGQPQTLGGFPANPGMGAPSPMGGGGGMGGGMAPMGGGGQQNNGWDRDGFRDARQDWRQAKPDFSSLRGDPQAMMAALMGWQDSRPQRSDFGAPQRPGAVPAAPAQQGFAPPGGLNPVPGPQANIPGMIGASYGVQGMTAPGSSFELPTY